MTAAEIQEFVQSGQQADTTFYTRSTELVARELLGALFIHHGTEGVLVARIVETEAYLAYSDEASHSYRGKTNRNASMFEQGGLLYVYKIYGIHHCINVVTETKGNGCAVLIRSMEPLLGIQQMKQMRGDKKIHELCKGPGNLARAFGFTIAHDAQPLTEDTTLIVPLPLNTQEQIITTPRVGIRKAADKPLRFLLKGNQWVSRPDIIPI